MKPIEDAANDVAAKLDDRDISPNDEFIDGFKKGIEFAQRWIPVEEELPPQNVLVLVKFDIVKGCDDITVLELSDENIWHYRGDDFFNQENITHWRPISRK